MNDVHYSSKSNEWETPQSLYDELDGEFGFTLDPCCTPENAKCETYFTVDDGSLCRTWKDHTVFMNPPYGREIGKWVAKAYNESRDYRTIVVCLLPARTDTKWFHDYCQKGEVRFLKGRLKFGNATTGAPFPSMVVIFR